jgi:uncharacterized repeat protein (TIGR03803 family)
MGSSSQNLHRRICRHHIKNKRFINARREGIAMRKVLTTACFVIFAMLAARGSDAAVNFRVLHQFDLTNGEAPYGHLISDGSRLYGMTAGDGIRNTGMIFSAAMDGSDFTLLHHFEGKAESPELAGDGQWPHGSLLLEGGTLYGLTWAGGCFWNLCDNRDETGCGTLFSLQPAGTGYQVLWEFACGDGDEGLSLPNAHLVSDGNRLYGTASLGGPFGLYGGGVFAVRPDGSGFEVLHAFDESSTADGSEPTGGLVLVNGVLYGTTSSGGAYGFGTVFSVRSDGSDFATLHHFSGMDGAFSGATPIVAAGKLYGVTMFGGAANNGVVFSMDLDGSDYQVIHDFTVAESGPMEGVIAVNGRLYGVTTATGGPNGCGVVYSLRPDGSDYKILHRLQEGDACWVDGRLLRVGNALYGLASHGGAVGAGTIFAFDLPSDAPAMVPAFTWWGLAAFFLLVGGAGYWTRRAAARDCR